jgi:hypothetical protein
VRNKYLQSLVLVICMCATAIADTTKVASDSAKALTPAGNGTGGIDNVTGLMLYGVALLMAILIIAVWRKNLMKNND